MTNFEHIDKDELAEALGETESCKYCSYFCEPECEDIPIYESPPCADGIRKWFDEESPYDD